MLRTAPILALVWCTVCIACGDSGPSETGVLGSEEAGEQMLDRATVLRELSSPDGKSEAQLLELAESAADHWYEESFPLLRRTFIEVWTPRVHALLAEAYGRNRDWRMLTGLFDLITDARAEPAPAGWMKSESGEQSWKGAHQAYYQAVFEITRREFESFAELQAWVRNNWEEILERADRGHRGVGPAD